MKKLSVIILLLGFAALVVWTDQPQRMEAQGPLGLEAETSRSGPIENAAICGAGECQTMTTATNLAQFGATTFVHIGTPATMMMTPVCTAFPAYGNVVVVTQ